MENLGDFLEFIKDTISDIKHKFKLWKERKDNMYQKPGEAYKKFTDEELMTYQKIFDKKGRKIIRFPDEFVVNSLEDVFNHLYGPIKTSSVYNKGKQHCYIGAARSVEDVYKIAKYYLPNVTVKDVYKAFEYLQLPHDNHNIMVQKSYCHTVKKVVHHNRNYTNLNVKLPEKLNITKDEPEIPSKSKKK